MKNYKCRNLRPQLIYRIIKKYISSEKESVIFEKIGEKGIITLNKPKKLNSLDIEMVSKIKTQLLNWKDNCSMVIIKGEGRAFCAGADVVNLTKNGPKYSNFGKTFFRTEYEMNSIIGSYPIPYVAFIDGITMGGGAGLSVHGSVRIATEKTLFAMPETAIGLFPDVGMTYILSRLQQKLGLFLGTTGYRLNGIDTAKIGIATHFVNSTSIESLFKELIKLKNSQNDLKSFLKEKTEDVNKIKDTTLAAHLKTIEKCFSASTMEDINMNLKKDGSEFAKRTYETMIKMSPISLKTTLKAIQLAQNKNLNDSLKTENRIANAICEAKISQDFYEGVRASLIDKDKSPKWNPSKIENVTDAMVNELFKELAPQDELKI